MDTKEPSCRPEP